MFVKDYALQRFFSQMFWYNWISQFEEDWSRRSRVIEKEKVTDEPTDRHMHSLRLKGGHKNDKLTIQTLIKNSSSLLLRKISFKHCPCKN